jgi:hypothetical protein
MQQNSPQSHSLRTNYCNRSTYIVYYITESAILSYLIIYLGGEEEEEKDVIIRYMDMATTATTTTTTISLTLSGHVYEFTLIPFSNSLN